MLADRRNIDIVSIFEMEERSVTQMQVPEPEKISSIKNKFKNMINYKKHPELPPKSEPTCPVQEKKTNSIRCK